MTRFGTRCLWLGLGLRLVTGAVSMSAQTDASAAGTPQVPAITVTVREVVMDVVALDAKGHSVTGLKAGDFQLVEDGVPQKIKGLSEHDAMTAAQVAAMTPAKLPPNTFSNELPKGNTNSVNVILIDALDSPVVAQMYLRQQLIAFMKTLPPGHLFAIFELNNSMQLVQGFTSDPEVLLKAVQSKREEVVLPYLLAKGNGAAREQILNAGLQVMGRYLAGFSGRKNLIWFTGVVPHAVFGLRNPFPDAVDYDSRRERAANALSLSRIAMYPIDDRGLEVGWGHFSHPELEAVADATGGKALFNNNGLKEGLTQVTETGSNYYTIAYSPTNPVWRAHHRDVTITATGKKITLLYRHKYYARSERGPQKKADAKAAARAFKPETPQTVAEGQAPAVPENARQDFGEAMSLGFVPSGELLFRLSVTPAITVTKLKKDEPLPLGSFLREDFRTKPFREYQLLYVVDPSRVNFELWSDGTHHAVLEFASVIFNAQGEVFNSLLTEREVVFDDARYQKALDGTLTLNSRQSIAIPEKGNYFLRTGIHDLGGELIGTVEVPVDTIQRGVAGAGMQVGP